MKKIISGFVITVFAIAPVVASAQTTTDVSALVARAQALIQQINTLAAQQGGVSAGTVVTAGSTVTGGRAISGVCPTLPRALAPGARGVDVSSLQQFLAQDRSIYPEGQVTGYYGALTQSAVQRWQIKYGVVTSGTPETTGFGRVGPKTLTAIAATCSPAITAQTGTPAIVAGALQVSPVSAAAPLAVNVTASVNLARSCAAATYILDFGDGTTKQQIVKPASTCTVLSQSFPHTYAAAGAYTITLSSGDHRSTVVVSAGGATVKHSISASPASGAAPLTVTFSGTALGSDAGSCTSNCTDLIDFGDGKTFAIPLTSGSTAYTTYTATHTYTAGGTYTAKLSTNPPNGSKQTLATTPVSVSGQGSAATNNAYAILSVLTGAGGGQSRVSVRIAFPSCSRYVLDWGDGERSEGGSTGGSDCSQTSEVIDHLYQSNGTVTLRLTNASGEQLATAALTISNAGSTFLYGITAIELGVSGNARSVSVRLLTPACPSYSIDWGDGSTPTTQSAQSSCSGTGTQTPLFTHTYEKAGSYSITLKNASSSVQSVGSFVL